MHYFHFISIASLFYFEGRARAPRQWFSVSQEEFGATWLQLGKQQGTSRSLAPSPQVSVDDPTQLAAALRNLAGGEPDITRRGLLNEAAETIDSMNGEVHALRALLSAVKAELDTHEAHLMQALEPEDELEVPAKEVLKVLRGIMSDLVDAKEDVDNYMASFFSATSSSSSSSSSSGGGGGEVWPSVGDNTIFVHGDSRYQVVKVHRVGTDGGLVVGIPGCKELQLASREHLDVSKMATAAAQHLPLGYAWQPGKANAASAAAMDTRAVPCCLSSTRARFRHPSYTPSSPLRIARLRCFGCRCCGPCDGGRGRCRCDGRSGRCPCDGGRRRCRCGGDIGRGNRAPTSVVQSSSGRGCSQTSSPGCCQAQR